jgi:copper chaperone
VNHMWVDLQVEGMTCEHCVASIKRSFAEDLDILSVVVSLEEGNVRVKTKESADLDWFRERLEGLGYDVLSIRTSPVAGESSADMPTKALQFGSQQAHLQEVDPKRGSTQCEEAATVRYEFRIRDIQDELQARRIEQALSSDSDVKNVEVLMDESLVRVETLHTVSIESLAQSIESVGVDVIDSNPAIV